MTQSNAIAANREEKNHSPRLKDLCKECGLDHNFIPTLGEDKADGEIPSLVVMLQQRRLIVEKMDVAVEQI
jgi:hypothetical protein